MPSSFGLSLCPNIPDAIKLAQLNSLQSAVLIHGPTETGKTFGIAAAFKDRVHPPRIPEAPREMTVILTVSNHAAINVAKKLWRIETSSALNLE
jgi:hypothetical protein